jgi:hypothetical protein
MIHIRRIVITYLNQVIFHLENGEYVTYSIDNGCTDGFIKKIGPTRYKVIIHPRYDNNYFVSDDVTDVQSVIGNLVGKNAEMVVYLGAEIEVMPHGRYQRFMNNILGFLFRKPNLVQEILRGAR